MLGLPTRKPRRFILGGGGGREGERAVACGDVWSLEGGGGGRAAGAATAAVGTAASGADTSWFVGRGGEGGRTAGAGAGAVAAGATAATAADASWFLSRMNRAREGR